MVMEMSKATMRRYNIGEFHSKYFKGYGIDIGCGPDSLKNHQQFFPLITDIKSWDRPDGDAQYLESIADNVFDFAVSSHCLEHLVDPFISLQNWIRVIKSGGYLIFTIPDEDLYEMCVFPSRFNSDHKHTFTINKKNSWCDKSINIFDLLYDFDSIQIIKIELLLDMYDYKMQKQQKDQTLDKLGPECSIEVILRKL